MKHKLNYILFLSTFSLYGYSQNISTILSVTYNVEQVEGEFIDPVTMLDESVIILDSAIMNDPAMQNDPMVIQQKTNEIMHQDDVNGSVSVVLLLSDTLNIDKIHYKLGRTIGGSDLLEGVMLYDDHQYMNTVSSIKVLNQISLNFGVFGDIKNLYSEFYIEDSAGNTSPVHTKELHL